VAESSRTPGAAAQPLPDGEPGAAMRHRLRAERERRGLSLRKLAAEVGISASALSQIETGRSRPSVTTLYALVSALGLSLDALFADDGAARDRPAAAAPDGAAGAPGDGAGMAGGAAWTAVDGGAAPGTFIRRARGRDSLEFTSGVRWEQLNAPGDPVEVLWLTYEPGSASGRDGEFMRHAGREYGIVISGRLAVSIWFETYELAPGDAISFASTAPHHLRALGAEAAHAVWFLLPDTPSSNSARPSHIT
jgi:transcriptional regulator with XRE-family HTH domain/mannose-6-phosphate isomerase-like protein (cupin superfamily)